MFLNTKLPSKSSHHAILYDGDDSIYLLGGFNATANASIDDIQLFSISSQKLTKIGTLPSPSCNGTVQWATNNKSIFYFGGGQDGKQVYEFDTATLISSRVAQLPVDVRFGSSFKIKDSSNTVHVLGGNLQKKQRLEFDMESWTSTVGFGTLSFKKKIHK